MNEFVAKKLGEVLAFALVGLDTLEKGKSGYKLIFNPDQLRIVGGSNNDFAVSIEAITKAHGVWDTTTTKAVGTKAKLIAMRDLYVKDEWDNPVELIEWSGFFLGAALVHWKLVEGAAESVDIPELSSLAQKAILYYEESLEHSSAYLKDTGTKRAAQ
jgi:hypothetical protein